MKEYDNRDSGVLFAQLSKRSEKAPDYSGELHLNAADMTAIERKGDLWTIKLSGWKKKSAKGSTFLSIAVNRYVSDDSKKAAPDPKPDEDVPF